MDLMEVADAAGVQHQPQQGRPAWVKVQADEFTAIVSTRTIFGKQPASLLASLAELEFAKQQPDPCVRLDCSAAVAQELVAVLRQGGSYEPPEDTRLLRALQQQVDYLGLHAPTVPQVPSSQECVVIPSYWYLDLNSNLAPSMDVQQAGLLVYSSAARGWANRCGAQDPRPSDLRGDVHPHSGGGCWLASVLRSETTGAGEDLCFCVPNKIISAQAYGDSALCLRASNLGARRVAMPPQHKRLRCCDAAMAAAQGKLYVLGGSCTHMEVPPTTPFEVYDPHLDLWFSAAPPLSGPVCLSGHALVANQQEGLLLTLGGCTTSGDKRHRQQRPHDGIAALDLRGGRWALNPSGCTWPDAATSHSASAVAAGPYTIMLLTAQHSGNNSGHCVRTCLLDLRTWRWREGTPLRASAAASATSGPNSAASSPVLHGLGAAAGALQQPYAAAAGPPGSPASGEDQECLLAHIGLVAHEGGVMAVGGRHWNGAESASAKVHAYDVARDAWGELRDLPYPVMHASPVSMRLPNLLS